jgi:hypothetical protein
MLVLMLPIAVLDRSYDGKTFYIAFASRALTDSEKGYGTSKRELLAIIEALQHFRYYLSIPITKLYVSCLPENIRTKC